MNNFFKAFLSFGLATSIEKLLGFILLPIYTKSFSSTEYGVIDMVMTIFQVCCVFGVLQLETSLQRYYYDYIGLRRKMLISTIYGWITIFSVILGLIMYLASSYCSQFLFNTPEYSNLFKIVSIQLPLTNISMLGLVLLRYERANFKFLIVIITKVVFSLVFVYIFIIEMNYGLEGVFLSQLLALLFSTLLVTYYVRNNFVFRISRFLSLKNFNYALPQFPARIGSMMLGQTNKFFMLGFLSLAAIGIYSVSLKLASSIQLVNTAFIMAWVPFMNAQFKNENNKAVFANVFPLILGVTFLCVCFISLFSVELVMLLATDEYIESSKYVGGLSLFFALYLIKEVVDIGPKIKEKTKYLSFTFLLSVIINIISLTLFIRFFNLLGVVYAMIITNLFLVLLSWTISNRLYYIPFSKMKFFISFVPTLIIILLMMNFDLSFLIRVLIGVFVLLSFGYMILNSYRNVKRVLK